MRKCKTSSNKKSKKTVCNLYLKNYFSRMGSQLIQKETSFMWFVTEAVEPTTSM